MIDFLRLLAFALTRLFRSEGIFGRVVTRAECERLALDCDPCSPRFCLVSQMLKRHLSFDEAIRV
jgi:hypothetical protein